MPALSSRRSVASALALGTLGAAAGGMWWLRSSAPESIPVAAAERPGLRLGLIRGAKVACPVVDAAAAAHELSVAAWLAFASLGEAGRAQLLDTLEGLADRVEARLHPLAVDLSDEPLPATWRREAAWFAPVWTAARAIARRCFVSGDRSLAVVVPESPGAFTSQLDSIDVSQRDAAPEARLARFLAWPICSARRVRAVAAPAPAGLWSPLRSRVAEPNSNLALLIDRVTQDVMPAALLSPDTQERMSALRERCRRFDVSACKECDELTDVLRAVSAELPGGPILPWLQLAPDEAWVVPRLAKLQRHEAFLSELQGFSELRVDS